MKPSSCTQVRRTRTPLPMPAQCRSIRRLPSSSRTPHTQQPASALADAGNIYGRLTNSTVDAFEQRIAALRGGVAALGVASGAAAINYTFLNLASAGATSFPRRPSTAAPTICSSTRSRSTASPQRSWTRTKRALLKTRLTIRQRPFIETIGNPNATLIDIEKVAAIAHAHKIPLVVDSPFATPYLLRPFEYGAILSIPLQSSSAVTARRSAALS